MPTFATTTILAYRIRIYPNNAQVAYFIKARGVERFVYNWALAEWRRLYAIGEKVSEGELRKKLNEMKRESFPRSRARKANAVPKC
jgi:putative transposase